MSSVRPHQLFTRYHGNPILTPDVWPYTINAAFNPGAAIAPNGETVLLVRVEDRTGLSHLTTAFSDNGYTDWRIEDHPSVLPRPRVYEELWGIEDPRITRIDDDYLIAYTGVSPRGPQVCLTSTTDFVEFRPVSAMTPPEDKDAALFAGRFGGRYALIHRPVSAWSRDGAHIWISFSPDLIHWGDHRVLIESRRTGHWDREKVGLGPPPLRTPHGWLLLFHGVKATAAGSLYRAGLALLDLENPTIVLARSDEWIFGPEALYERTGDVPGVVFPTGWIEDGEGSVRMYYGAADTCVALATARTEDLVSFVVSHSV